MDEAIRTGQFIHNKALRYWMDNKGVGKYQLSAYCKVLAAEFSFAHKLNSMARQSSADRAWAAISRFYSNCKKRRDPAALDNNLNGGNLRNGFISQGNARQDIKYKGRKDIQNSKNTLVRLNTRLAVGSYPSFVSLRKLLSFLNSVTQIYYAIAKFFLNRNFLGRAE